MSLSLAFRCLWTYETIAEQDDHSTTIHLAATGRELLYSLKKGLVAVSLLLLTACLCECTTTFTFYNHPEYTIYERYNFLFISFIWCPAITPARSPQWTIHRCYLRVHYLMLFPPPNFTATTHTLMFYNKVIFVSHLMAIILFHENFPYHIFLIGDFRTNYSRIQFLVEYNGK